MNIYIYTHYNLTMYRYLLNMHYIFLRKVYIYVSTCIYTYINNEINIYIYIFWFQPFFGG